MAAIHESARHRGLARARVNGFAGGISAHQAELSHAAVGAVVCAIALVSLSVALVLLALLALSAGARAAGWAGLGDGVPRVPCWNLVLRRPARIATLVIAPLDRVRLVTWLPWVLFGGMVVAMLAVALGTFWVGSAALAGVALTAWGVDRVPVTGDEARDVETLLSLAAELPPASDVAVVISGACARGDGARAFLDWWALTPASTRIVVLGATPAAVILAGEGWHVVRATDLSSARALLTEPA